MYCQTEHSVARGGPVQKVSGEVRGNEPRTYRMVFLEKSGPRACPVQRCSGWAVTQISMQVKFWHRHVRDIVVILEEGNLPHPR